MSRFPKVFFFPAASPAWLRCPGRTPRSPGRTPCPAAAAPTGPAPRAGAPPCAAPPDTERRDHGQGWTGTPKPCDAINSRVLCSRSLLDDPGREMPFAFFFAFLPIYFYVQLFFKLFNCGFFDQFFSEAGLALPPLRNCFFNGCVCPQPLRSLSGHITGHGCILLLYWYCMTLSDGWGGWVVVGPSPPGEWGSNHPPSILFCFPGLWILRLKFSLRF